MDCLRPGGLELTRHALSFAALTAESRVLDLGCGRGETLALLRGEYGCWVAAVEPDQQRRAQAEANNPGVEIAAAAAEQLPFADDGFDLALAECSVSLFSQPQAALAEIKRVLIPAGRLIITDVYARQEAGWNGEGMIRRLYTLKQFRSLLSGAGFNVRHGEDCSSLLKTMLGQMILDYGREEAYRRLGLDSCALRQAGAGYLLLVAEAMA